MRSRNGDDSHFDRGSQSPWRGSAQAFWQAGRHRNAVPTPNVSAVDLTVETAKIITVEAVNAIIEEAAARHMGHLLCCDSEPKVSIDFNHTPYSTIFAPNQTKVIGGRTVCVLAWYYNERRCSCHVANVAVTMGQLLH